MTTEQNPEPQGEGDGKPQGEPTKQETKPPQGEQSPPQGSDTGDTTDWKAEARKWEKAAKKDAAEKSKAEANLETIRNLLDGKDKEATEAQQAAAAAQLEATKYRVAYEAGLPPDLASRLVGASEAELVEDANRLAQYAKPKKQSKSDARSGTGKPASDGGTPDKNQMLREMFGARS